MLLFPSETISKGIALWKECKIIVRSKELTYKLCLLQSIYSPEIGEINFMSVSEIQFQDNCLRSVMTEVKCVTQAA